MTLDQIRYFVAAAEYQHVGKAARSVPISASAISAAIAVIEEEINAQLFERRSKRIHLSPVGHQFKTWAVSVIQDIDTVRFRIGRSTKQLEGRYRLGASHFLALELLGPAWFTLQEKHPGLIGDLHSLDTGFLVADILAGRLDLGVGLSVVSHPDIEQIRVHEGDLVIAVHKSHPLLKTDPSNRLRKLSKYPAATHKPTQGTELCKDHPIFSKLRIVPTTSLYFDSDEIALSKLRKSWAWALLPDFIVRKRSKELTVIYRDRDGRAPYFISVLKHRSKILDTTLLKLIEQIRRCVR